MAEIETAKGEYAAAVRHATEAAAIFARRGDPRARGLALNRIGLAHLYAGEYRQAIPQFTEAMAAAAAAGNADGRVEALSNLGNVYFFLGRYGDAEAAYATGQQMTRPYLPASWAERRRRLLLVNQATLDQRLGRDEQALERYRAVEAGAAELRPSERAQILTNLGVLYRRLGDPVKALQAYDQARALFTQDGHLDGELGVLKNRGIVLALDLNQPRAAQQNFTDALARASRASNRREMLQAQLYRGETELRLGEDAAAAADFSATLAAARELKTPEEEWKSLFGLGRLALRSGKREEAIAAFERALAVIETIREAIHIPTLRSDYFNDKREVYDALIALELGRGATARAFDLMERSRSRVWRDRLGLTSPVSLAAVQTALPAGALLLETWSSRAGTAVVLLTRERVEVTRATLDPALIGRLSDALSRGPGGTWQPLARQIAGALLPRPLPEGTTSVIVVPDGPLALVPFEILPAGPGMLVESVAVSYVPTAAIVLRQPASRSVTNLQLRAFASTALNASVDEVRGIAAELGGRSVLHIGTDNRKEYLSDAKEAAPLLHIASHAVADDTAMERSRIAFAPRPGQREPDYLFLKEAYDLPLRGVELAVLSACETERGRMVTGEGVQSFSRALLAAGARSTVTTLWAVPDRSTAAFMKLFYEHLQRGESRAEALRRTKLRFVGRDPHYWAAFVLTGEAATPIPRVPRRNSVALRAAAAAVLIVAAAWALARLRA
jgi:tetratricopeptide (TPR) repeat protein